MMLKATNRKNFSALDLLEKLNLLEELVFHKLTSKSNSIVFNSNLKLLLEIIKLKHKIKPKEKEINFLNLLNLTNKEKNSNP